MWFEFWCHTSYTVLKLNILTQYPLRRLQVQNISIQVLTVSNRSATAHWLDSCALCSVWVKYIDPVPRAPVSSRSPSPAL